MAEIERESFSDPWSEESLRSVLGVGHIWCFVATGLDRSPPEAAPSRSVEGFIIVVVSGEEAEIVDFAVSRRMRRTGVGQLLIDHVLDRGAMSGVCSVYLEVRESNVAALGLYRSRRFEQVGVRRRFYREPVENALVLLASIGAARGGSQGI